jgi:hypothetical protein
MQNLHSVDPASQSSPDSWPRPSFEVISLDCEITSYAPDDGDPRPLF